MVVFGQVGQEHTGFDVKVDASQRIVEVGFDGNDGSFIGKYLPVGFRHCFSDVGGYRFFFWADQQDDGCIAFGKAVGSSFVSGVVAGEDEPAMAEVAIVAHLG